MVCLHSVSVALNWLKSSNIEAITCFPTQDFALRTSFCQALTHTRSVVIAWWLAVLRKDTTVAWGPPSNPRGRGSSQSQAQSSRWSQDATFEQQNSKSEFWSVYTIFSTKSNCNLTISVKKYCLLDSCEFSTWAQDSSSFFRVIVCERKRFYRDSKFWISMNILVQIRHRAVLSR